MGTTHFSDLSFESLSDDAAGAVRGVTTKNAARKTIVVLGDSIPQGSIPTIPLAVADAGYYGDRSSTLSATTANGFVVGVNCLSNCGSSDALSIEWDGVSRISVGVAGDTAGASVDVTGGGFFAFTSGTNGKGVVLMIRWRNRPAAATWASTNSGTATPSRISAAGLFTGALARTKLLSQNVLNYAIGGDRTTDILNRVGQVTALRPDLVLFMAGANSISTAGVEIPQILEALTSAGIPVVVSKTLPRTWTADEVAQLDALNASLVTLAASNPLIALVDASSPLRDPTQASGNGLVVASQFNSDFIHPHYVASFGRVADVVTPALRAMLPGIGYTRPVSAGAAYNAASNARGNLIGARGAMGGTGGTKGATPTATGDVPDNWVDTYGGSGTGFTSVVFKAPSSSSPVPRADIPGKYWTEVIASTAQDAGGSLRILQSTVEFPPTPGKRYRLRLAMQLLNVSNLVELNVGMNCTGGPTAAFRLMTLGSGAVTSTLEDSGVLYLESPDMLIPAGVTAASVRISYSCTTGGSITLRVADFDLFEV